MMAPSSGVETNLNAKRNAHISVTRACNFEAFFVNFAFFFLVYATPYAFHTRTIRFSYTQLRTLFTLVPSDSYHRWRRV